jgi:hypothetical protein
MQPFAARGSGHVLCDELGGDEWYLQHPLVADDRDLGRMVDQLGDQQPL